MKLFVKNMVCNRCVFVVEKELHEIGLSPISVVLGEVDFGDIELKINQITEVKEFLESFGFQLLDDKASRLIEKTKLLLLDYVSNHLESTDKTKLSDYLKIKLNSDYNYVSNLFSSIAGVTIEHYLIKLKIEKVKELLVYDELTLSEIAHKMGYSSVAHLSGQFKRETGLTPSYFKKMKHARGRLPLDNL